MGEFRRWLGRAILSWAVLLFLLITMTVEIAILLPVALEHAMHAPVRMPYSQGELFRIALYVALPLSILGIVAVELKDLDKRLAQKQRSAARRR